MDGLAAGFWGAFFGTATLMLAASLVAFARSQRRVALTRLRIVTIHGKSALAGQVG